MLQTLPNCRCLLAHCMVPKSPSLMSSLTGTNCSPCYNALHFVAKFSSTLLQCTPPCYNVHYPVTMYSAFNLVTMNFTMQQCNPSCHKNCTSHFYNLYSTSKLLQCTLDPRSIFLYFPLYCYVSTMLLSSPPCYIIFHHGTV